MESQSSSKPSNDLPNTLTLPSKVSYIISYIQESFLRCLSIPQDYHAYYQNQHPLFVKPHCAFVSELLGKRHVVLRPVARTCSFVIPGLFLVKDFLEITRYDLAEDFVGVEKFGTIGKLSF